MKELSDCYYTANPHSLQRESPQAKIKDPNFQAIQHKFIRLCLAFSFKKLQHRVNAKFSKFCAVSTKGLAAAHPFHRVRKSVCMLEYFFTQELNPRYGKPKPEDDKLWALLYVCLCDVKESVYEFLGRGGFQGEDGIRILHFLKLETYLKKITSIFNSISILIKASVSPQCRDIFMFRFKLQTLPALSCKVASIPETAADWEKVLETALAHNNRYGIRDKTGTQVMDIDVIAADTAYMARDVISRNPTVHCETKLMVAIHKAQLEQPSLPRAYSYIGVSKLSCNGCDCFIRAFNHIHNTTWVTKGSHGKSYYPWFFPPTCPKGDDVLKDTYHLIVEGWVKAYKGYRQQFVPLRPDSTSQSSRSTGAFLNFTKEGVYAEVRSDAAKEFDPLYLHWDDWTIKSEKGWRSRIAIIKQPEISVIECNVNRLLLCSPL